MRKNLLLLVLPLFLFTATLNAQDIMYWDFGARELGPGYKNMLPHKYLNGFATRPHWGLRQWETQGRSTEYLTNHPYWSTARWGGAYPGYTFGWNSTGAEDEGGVRLSGGSSHTDPIENLPYLDENGGVVNLIHNYFSNNDAYYTVRKDLTREDERDLMPYGDEAFASHFPGALQIGYKDGENRGLTITGVPPSTTITIVGSGAFKFAPAGDQLDEEELDGDATTTTDDLRVIKFTAEDGGDYYILSNFGNVHVYRVYMGDVNPNIAPTAPLIKVLDFGGEMLDTSMYDNIATAFTINDAVSDAGAGNPLVGRNLTGTASTEDPNVPDLNTISTLYNDYDYRAGREPWGLGANFHGNYFTQRVWFIHNSDNADRLRTSNTDIVAYDDNVGGNAPSLGLTGRVYVNSAGNRERYFSIRSPKDNQMVTVLLRVENSGGSTYPETVEVEGIDLSGASTGVSSYNLSDGDVKALQLTLPNKDVDYQIYSASGSGKLSVYRIYFDHVEFAGAETLDVDKIASPVKTDVRAIGNRVYVSNVKSNTEINIYSITGALVKSLKTDVNTDFEFNSGLFIATIKTAEGQKSVKFVTK